MPQVDDSAENRYWPFEVLPQEKQSDRHRRQLRFLEEAYAEGFHPYLFGSENYGASNEPGRGGLIIHRGRNRWEIVLGTSTETLASRFVDDFDCAANAVLQWLRGGCLETIVAETNEHAVQMPGSSQSERSSLIAGASFRTNSAGEP